MQLTSFCGLPWIYTNTRNETELCGNQLKHLLWWDPCLLSWLHFQQVPPWSRPLFHQILLFLAKVARSGTAGCSRCVLCLSCSIAKQLLIWNSCIFQSLLHTHPSSFHSYGTHLSLLPHCSRSTFHNRPLAWNGGFITSGTPCGQEGTLAQNTLLSIRSYQPTQA